MISYSKHHSLSYCKFYSDWFIGLSTPYVLFVSYSFLHCLKHWQNYILMQCSTIEMIWLTLLVFFKKFYGISWVGIGL